MSRILSRFLGKINDGLAALTTQRSGALSLRANFSWMLVGNVIYGLCQWGMLVALVKFCPVEQVGQFALGLAISAPVFMLLNLNLRVAQATDSHQTYKFDDYLSVRLATSLLALFIILGIALLARYQVDTLWVVIGVAVMKTFESISDVFYGLIQQRERMDRIAQSLILKGVLSVAVLALITFLFGQVLWGVVGLGATWAVMLAGFDLPIGIGILRSDQPILGSTTPSLQSFRQRWPELVRLVMLTLPLGFATLLSSLNTNMPNYFLNERNLGIFNAIAYLVIAGNRVVLALAQSAIPRLARSYANGDRKDYLYLWTRLLLIAVAVGAATLLVTLIGGKPLLTLIYRPEYAEHMDLFVLVMIAATIGYVALCLEYAITAARRFRDQSILLIATVSVMLTSCALLIPPYGLVGAALAMIASAVVELLGALYVNALMINRFYIIAKSEGV